MDASERRKLILPALRCPRGRYSAPRASQLSGVPKSTVYEWAREGVLVPDYAGASPRMWSYRDLLFLRLMARIRQFGVNRAKASEAVKALRGHLTRTRADSGQQAISEVLALTHVFDMTEPIDGATDRPMWGPDLLQPSAHTYISPQVMGGEPCVASCRVPTTSVLALVKDRGLAPDNVVRLYPQLTTGGVEDAVALEQRLQMTRAA